MDAINIDVFVRQLIADKCSALIESEGLLPDDHLVVVKQARDEYFKNPTNKNYDYIKRLFSQTKFVDDSIESKDFHRRIMLIVFKLALNKSKTYFVNYKSVLEVALKRLDGINPDLKSSPRALLQHYNECLDRLDNPRNEEHHLISFAKEIATKIFIETIDLYSYTNKSPFVTQGPPAIIAPSSTVSSPSNLFQTTVVKNNFKQKRTKRSHAKIVTPLFAL
ncbi:ORF-87 [Buzura suppressaria nucleopolyhedrovirus]|uniref:ORF-87 n=1 Tax=Buzura suppressaria nuclear polyhedrosis virus TaxID=74320 RepID=W5VKL5_NPVBS|nr:ORF-87 [Buzura suppressaria nucleopolyhedrovirus]AHH82676.1 ORF-87 [Buzura suppressaria nucleopolyhedrovirus]AKN91060.1 ORF-90 [Buzura suppressaria nucleopolyhedrovirus]QYF10636.1 ac106-like [Buzura suppressaria nucleopolyhedrovirus]